MRHKLKKEALDVIVQKITNDPDGLYLADLLKIAKIVRSKENMTLQECFATAECQEVLKKFNWLYGYENETQETLETIKSMLEKKVFNKEACHVTIISGMVCYCTLLSIFDANFDPGKWDKAFEECENKRLIACLEVLQRHCPETIDVEGFREARRYIRIWDSAYNW